MAQNIISFERLNAEFNNLWLVMVEQIDVVSMNFSIQLIVLAQAAGDCALVANLFYIILGFVSAIEMSQSEFWPQNRVE